MRPLVAVATAAGFQTEVRTMRSCFRSAMYIHFCIIGLSNRRVSKLKPIPWFGTSLARLCAAPAKIRPDAGYQLDLVQPSETPADCNPMPDVGSGVSVFHSATVLSFA